ncbi:MAG TPA: hypothetical protein VKK79_15525, partial [Candidatus Lokiarchaeia archaeon]|nr:hypothetical protein [Candidatus Lokiarchaeia archaeon]
ALIQKFLFGWLHLPWNFLLVIVLAILSHFIVDVFVKITFHTPEPHPEWRFWVIANTSFYVASVITAIILFIPYWWAMLAANVIDIYDWVILRPVQAVKRKKNPEYTLEKYMIHPRIERFRDKHLTWVPNLLYDPKGVIPEIIIDIILFLLLYLL